MKFKLKRIKFKCKGLKFKNHIPTPPKSPNFLVEVDFPQAHPMDSADLLREKSAIILQSFFKEIPRDPFSCLDIIQKLGQTVSSVEIVTRDDLSLVLDLLQNPGSEL